MGGGENVAEQRLVADVVVHLLAPTQY